MAKTERQKQVITAPLEFERALWLQGIQHVAGVDEAGRGPLAGPVVAAAVILHPGQVLEGVNDSKQLTPARREALYEQICAEALAVAIGWAGPEQIDAVNILQATRQAMVQAIRALPEPPQHLLIDAVRLTDLLPDIAQTSLIQGDVRAHSIAAASIVAKVTRDRYMERLDAEYPQYGFAAHKGYPTPQHLAALVQHGPSPVHRRSFRWQEAAGVLAAATESAPAPLPSRTQLGQDGEDAVARHVQALGWRVLARNVRLRFGEIDLVAEDGGCIVFIEVKTRRSAKSGAPEEAVDGRKQERLRRLAEAFLASRGWQDRPVRFDVLAVYWKKQQVEHIRNAF